MLPLDRIPWWSNWGRRRLLLRVRSSLEEYFGAVTYEAFPFRVVESDEARRIRGHLQGPLKRCRRIVRATGTVPLLRYAPGERAGDVERVNLLAVVFELERYSLGKEDVFAALDAALRAYESGRAGSLLRTLNPFYWLEMGLDALEAVPFLLLRPFGVKPERAANSVPGTIVRLLVRATALSALVVLVILASGLQDEVLELGQNLLRRWPWLAHVLRTW